MTKARTLEDRLTEIQNLIDEHPDDVDTDVIMDNIRRLCAQVYVMGRMDGTR